ncbi:hypothetical protein [Ferruginibacter sp. SUN106]|uniref:hypothetical protein n=1 Tax=Ferruginibacter sp. SUN106 TaxID=2978348 RepID=UPI003D360172
MTTYIVFLKSSQKSTNLPGAYFKFFDTTYSDKLNNHGIQFVLNDLSSKDGFNYCGVAGYSGAKIPVINPTALFKQNLSEPELIVLCQQSGPVVKHFAFKALCELNPKSAKQIFEKQIFDSTEIDFQCGCFGDFVTINLDFLNTLKDKLTDIDRVLYLKKIKMNCSPLVYESGVKFFNL